MEKILVIEDDFVFCKLLSNYLNKNGYSASQAANGAEAKGLLESNEYDLAVIDYRLPDTNGVEITKWISESDLKTKVILMSRLADADIPREGAEAGSMHFLNKPFKPAELLEIISGM